MEQRKNIFILPRIEHFQRIYWQNEVIPGLDLLITTP
jgi:hypothetical protein